MCRNKNHSTNSLMCVREREQERERERENERERERTKERERLSENVQKI